MWKWRGLWLALFVLFGMALLGGSALAASAAKAPYAVVKLGDFNSAGPQAPQGSGAFAINSHGDSVGWSYYADNDASSHAALFPSYGSRRPVDLRTLFTIGFESSAAAINDYGIVVGSSGVNGFAGVQPFVWQGGVMRSLFEGIPGCGVSSPTTIACTGSAYDVNNRNQIVGYRSFPEARAGGQTVTHAGPFLYQAGVFHDLPFAGLAVAVNDRGDILGSPTARRCHFFVRACSGLPDRSQPPVVLYSHGTVTDLGTLGGASSIGNDLSGNAVVVGSSLLANGDQHAFLYSNGRMRDLGTLGGTFSEATGISPGGDFVVGNSTTASGDTHAFIYVLGRMIDLNDLIPARVGTVFDAEAVTDQGVIVGRVSFTGGKSDAAVLIPRIGVWR
jgi:probable HAF family extracellular repeat protein